MALAIEAVLLLLTLSGLAYMVIALLGRPRLRALRPPRQHHRTALHPGVTLLKPLKGIDARMYAGARQPLPPALPRPLRDHLRRQLPRRPRSRRGRAPSRRVPRHPHPPRRLPRAPRHQRQGLTSSRCFRTPRYEHVVVNDSDILVAPALPHRVMRCFADDARRHGHRAVPRRATAAPPAASASGRGSKRSASPPTSCPASSPRASSKAASASASAPPSP